MADDQRPKSYHFASNTGEWADLRFIPPGEGGEAAPGEGAPAGLQLEDGEFLYWDWIALHSDKPLGEKLQWMHECYSHVAGLVEKAYPVNTEAANRFNTVGLLYTAVWPLFTNPLIAADPLAAQQVLEWIHSACNLLWDLLPPEIRQADQVAFMGQLAERLAGEGGPGPESTAIALTMGQRLAAFAAGLDAELRARVQAINFQIHPGPPISERAARSAGHTGDLTCAAQWRVLEGETLRGQGDANFCTDPGCQTCWQTVCQIFLGGVPYPATKHNLQN